MTDRMVLDTPAQRRARQYKTLVDNVYGDGQLFAYQIVDLANSINKQWSLGLPKGSSRAFVELVVRRATQQLLDEKGEA